MLLRFAVTNFRSLKDEQELSLIASPLDGNGRGVTRLERFGADVLRAIAIYGANASGKTNVLRALHFMSVAVANSQTSWKPDQRIPRQAFRLNTHSGSEASHFEVDLFIQDARFQYGFSITSQRVLDEWLFAFPAARRQLWFRRKDAEFTFGKKLGGENRVIQRVTRPNSLFLSAAAQNNHEQLTPIYRWFASELNFLTTDRAVPRYETLEMCENIDTKRRIENILAAADLGLLGFETSERPLDEGTQKIMAALRDLMPENSRPPMVEKLPDVAFLHRCEHNSPVSLEMGAESDGTIAFFSLLGPAMAALQRGGTLCIDELDSSLHPLLALELVRLFNDDQTNVRGAQLIFNTHDTNLLDPAVLRRDQVWFTEKDNCGATHLYPLTDFKPRKVENLQRGYLQGRYGAIPFLGHLQAFDSVVRADGT